MTPRATSGRGTRQQLRQRDARFESSERCADTVVDAAAKAEVQVRVAAIDGLLRLVVKPDARASAVVDVRFRRALVFRCGAVSRARALSSPSGSAISLNRQRPRKRRRRPRSPPLIRVSRHSMTMM